MKDVSVVITSYNKGKLIQEALDSVKNQTFKNVEIIIIDDLSTDKDTLLILAEIAKTDIKVILLDKNIGVSETRNIGIRQSEGKYILLLDGDDKIAPSYIEKAVKVLESNPEIKVVSSEVELFGYMKGKMSLAEPLIENLIAQNSIIISSLFRRADFDMTKGFNKNMNEGLEDWDFWLSMLENGGEVYRIPEIMFYYRISKKSRNNLDAEKLRRLRRLIYENHKELYASYLLDPVNSFEYSLLVNSREYRIGKFLLKPLRSFISKLR
ncbi:MAG: glycosyltransferase family A protein [Bacteroidetes bacterium]|nr:glycosyltransferase family A protein [Bacteroidota bacterium]